MPPRDAVTDPETGRWEHFEHEADIGVRGCGPTRAAAFAQAGRALTEVLLSADDVAATEAVEITAEAPDDEILLVDFLNELIYEMATRRMVFRRFEVAIDDHQLRATAWGEPVDLDRHRAAVEAKGATYTALSVHQADDGAWVAQCVVDV